MDFAYYILTPFSWLLQLFNSLTGGYGFALILFAVVVKLILFPFSLKSKRSMIQMNMLSGKMQQIQRKYANDKERQNLEIQKLYEKEKVNPMSGCLWSLVPLFILIPLYAIIRQPLKYMMGLTPDQISAVAEALNWAQVSIDNGWVRGVADAAANVFKNDGYNQLFLASLINPDNLAMVQEAVGSAGHVFAVNFSFLGMDLSQVPQLKFWANGLDWDSIGRFLIPIVSAGTGLFFSLVTNRTNQMNNQQISEQQKSTNRTMLIVMPLMSLWIGFSMPAALGVYWVAQNLLSMIQEFLAGKMLKKDYEAAAAARAEQERLEKEEEKQRRREAAERKARAIAEAKANKGKKKAKPVEEKKKSDASVIDVSRVGIRSYARGRAYDPYRYSPDGPTPYKDPGAPVDESAVEKALEKKSDHLQAVAAEDKADQLILDELKGTAVPETEEAAQADSAAEVIAEAAAADAEDPWAGIDAEVEAINAETQDKDKE